MFVDVDRGIVRTPYLMLLQEKTSNGNREPAVVPPREITGLSQIRKKEGAAP